MNPFRTMLDRGVVVGAGSDAPVTPLDPCGAVAALEGHHDRGAASVSGARRPRSTRSGGARVGHQEDKKGALAPGMHADFAAFDADPFTVAERRGLRPVLTVSLGREVFAALSERTFRSHRRLSLFLGRPVDPRRPPVVACALRHRPGGGARKDPRG